MQPESRVLWGCSLPPVILTRSPQLYFFQSGKQRKVWWVGTTVMLFFGKKFPVEKGNVRCWVVVKQQPVLSSPEFGAKSSHIFTQSPKTSEQYAELVVWPARTNSLWIIPLISENGDEHSLDLALHLSPLFGLGEFGHFHYTAHAFFLERLSDHYHGLRRTSSEICTKFDGHSQSDPSRHRIMPDTRLLTKWRKESVRPSSRALVYTLMNLRVP
jgi:hypothetical protein